MSYHERMRTIEFCVEHVNGRVPVIAGSGSNATENAISLSGMGTCGGQTDCCW